MATTIQPKSSKKLPEKSSEQSSQRDNVAIDGKVQDSQNRGMVVVGQVAGGILHDFNNILTVITGTIEILAQAVEDRPELAAVAQLIDEAASRGVRMTSQLMGFASGRPPRPCDVDIDELLADVGRLLRPTLGTQIEVVVTVEPGTPTVFADPGQLMAALLCLAIAARDSLSDGSKISLEGGIERVLPRAAQPGIVIALRASGLVGGITHPDHVFSDMTMVEEFVERSNGRLKIDFSSDLGAVVEIVLPRRDALA